MSSINSLVQAELLRLDRRRRAGDTGEALNPRPDAFEPLREGRRSLGFGQGAHGCPGAAIAIEMVACTVRWLGSAGTFDAYPARHAGYRPLPNARVPVFAPN